MTSRTPPQHVQILVIGGGPSGSYTASALAREGFDVVLFEAAQFPRYHIGESLIPSVRQYLKFIDVEQTVLKHGFYPKPGSAIKFNQYKKEGYTDFVALGHDNAAWNVIRSEFDHILLKHASVSGARVFERTRVDYITFDGERPISAAYTSLDSSTASNITFDYLVDATGRAGILSTKYLKNRTFTESLKNIAVWGYWTGVKSYGVGTSRQGAPFFEALTDESGWAWFIPLHSGMTSVGVVMNQKMFNDRVSKQSSKTESPSETNPKASRSTFAGLISNGFRSLPWMSGAPADQSKPPLSVQTVRYLDSLKLAPTLKELIGDGNMIEYPVKKETGNFVHQASDFSYSASQYSGDRFRIIGDAAAFIDPFFSSGVHLALTGALSAAATIASSIRGQCTEKEAAKWHHERVGTSYTRFLIVVLSAYKQMRNQSSDVLSDIDEEGFDRAFKFLRPVIQGGGDMGRRLSEDELQAALDFCVKLFNPTTPAEHAVVNSMMSSEGKQDLMDVHAPVIDPAVIEKLSQSNGDGSAESAAVINSGVDIKMILDKVNARKLIHAESGVHNFEEEPLGGEDLKSGGYVVKLVKGQLGLVKVDEAETN